MIRPFLPKQFEDPKERQLTRRWNEQVYHPEWLSSSHHRPLFSKFRRRLLQHNTSSGHLQFPPPISRDCPTVQCDDTLVALVWRHQSFARRNYSVVKLKSLLGPKELLGCENVFS